MYTCNNIYTTNTSCHIANYSSSTNACTTYTWYGSDATKEDIVKAVEAIYNMGYITYDEVRELVNKGYAYRNECTPIFLTAFGDKIIIYCSEFTKEDYKPVELLFKLSYDKYSGNVIDVLKKAN